MSDEEGPQRRCSACGSQVPWANMFCGACGTRLPPAGQEAEDALIGQVIDNRFRIVRLLGSGGMGAIYLAEHVGIGKRVAIKLLRADLRGQPKLVGRFRREAMAVSKLTDLHTITVFDFGVWQGLVYLVMEYLQGRDLARELAAEGRLSVERTLHIAHQICSSLAEAHAVGVVHRDLKPENVFLTRTTSGDELVKVLDFGLAKILAPEAQQAEGLFQTQDGALLGTPYFMSPEQVRGDEVDSRSDLYSLGALMYRMLAGRVPFPGKGAIEVLEAHLSAELPPFAEVAPEAGIPAEVEALVRHLMARDHTERPPTALAVDDRIALLLGNAAELPEAPPVVEAAAPVAEPAPTPAVQKPR
ncbi:MAG: protein kinase, partial [Myxococcales bacterium]|nr:protein kinase [Myxococcales bacterium]